jgi:ribosomal protein L7/L12
MDPTLQTGLIVLAILIGIVLVVKTKGQEYPTGYHPNASNPANLEALLASKGINLDEPGIYLLNAGRNKIGAIKEIREATGLGLKEAKDIVDAAPCRLDIPLEHPQADRLIATLRQLGAEVQVKCAEP